jgi:hypothetical protein
MDLRVIDYGKFTARHRVFLLDNGDLLAFSRERWQDLPAPPPWYPPPSGFRHWMNERVFGASIARTLWRCRTGQSDICAGVRKDWWKPQLRWYQRWWLRVGYR